MDRFSTYSAGLDSPASHAFAITPDDDADLDVSTRAIYCGGDGDLAVITTEGDSVTFVGVATGAVIPVRVRRVLEASTATNLVGLA